MTALPKQRLHDLVDQLSEDQLEPAERYLSSLCNGDDPVIRAIRSAPIDDEPVTDEDRQAIAEGYQDIAAGRVFSNEQIRHMLEP